MCLRQPCHLYPSFFCNPSFFSVCEWLSLWRPLPCHILSLFFCYPNFGQVYASKCYTLSPLNNLRTTMLYRDGLREVHVTSNLVVQTVLPPVLHLYCRPVQLRAVAWVSLCGLPYGTLFHSGLGWGKRLHWRPAVCGPSTPPLPLWH